MSQKCFVSVIFSTHVDVDALGDKLKAAVVTWQCWLIEKASFDSFHSRYKAVFGLFLYDWVHVESRFEGVQLNKLKIYFNKYTLNTKLPLCLAAKWPGTI